ncbi:peptide-methionine (R)-S-oxide reductase MsrB [Hellea balneolensis]|uniref:peptide-methionine (R)-S-oxide reductase MsrB n=1 Tax=Hellea balneolensis TaxID=287478 RepID=UPI00040847F9|nr:peptide-methionine (R)-S-oxide reductase MsrB [Hellea balneolensis]
MLTKRLSRRDLGLGVAALAVTACAKTGTDAQAQDAMEMKMSDNANGIDWANLSEREWKERLTPMEFNVLRKEGTERPGSSPLNDEKREGTFVCAGCALPLFKSEHKYESGTGWPSFFDVIEENIGTKTDRKLFMARTEYHCKRCGGHQGHVFKDGPRPTGLRYCNNGVALDFVES